MDYADGESIYKETVEWVEGKGREKQIAKHKAAGRLLVRERLDFLLDKDSFVEYGKFAYSNQPGYKERSPRDAILTGFGTINGKKVAVIAEDRTVMGGTHGEINLKKVDRLAAIAFEHKVPIISLAEGGGGRVPDLLGVGLCRLFDSNKESIFFTLGNRLKRPLFIGAVFGPSYGDPAIRTAMADFTIMVKDAAFALAGPPLVEAAIGSKVTDMELGGPAIHQNTGIVDFIVDNEIEALNKIKEIMTIIRPPEETIDPIDRPVPELKELVPANPRVGYDIYKFIKTICDNGECLEISPFDGLGVVTAIGRMAGRAVGFIASQPKNIAGVIDSRALIKMTNFITLLNREHIPLVVLQDVPGVMVGQTVEKDGLLRELMNYINAMANADQLLTITLIIRKSYGVAYFFMGNAATGAKYVAAWPNAEIGFLAPEAGAAILLKNEKRENKWQLIKQKAAEFSNNQSVWNVAGEDLIDDIILPEDTRSAICKALNYLTFV